MPLLRSYLSYDNTECFGVISSPSSNSVLHSSGQFAFTAALHKIILWKLGEGNEKCVLVDGDSIVTCLAICNVNSYLFAGYEDGKIRIWDYGKEELIVTLNGHNNKVTCLSVNENGTRLASGSNDTDIVIWDIVDERGLFRLKGHHQPVTQIEFLNVKTNMNETENGKNENESGNEYELLLSSSKDSCLKLWQLDTQHCLQTIVGHKHEVWCFAISKDKEYMVSCASMESEIFVWKIEKNEKIFVRRIGGVSYGASMGKKIRITQLQFNSKNNILFCATNSNMIQLFYVRNDSHDMKNRLKLKLQKLKRKSMNDNNNKNETNVDKVEIEGIDYLVALAPIRTRHKLASIDVCSSMQLCKDKRNENNSKKKKSATQDTIIAAKDAFAELAQKIEIENIETNFENDSEFIEKLKENKEINFDELLLQPILASFDNNSISLIKIGMYNGDKDVFSIDKWQKYLSNYCELNCISIYGHRSAIRSLCFSFDDTMICSTDKTELKVWNSRTQECIRTCNAPGYGLQCLFVAGNKHIIVACKNGNLLLFDLITNTLLDSYIGHNGAIYAMKLSNNNYENLITGGGDCNVKIWDFDLKFNESVNKKQLCLKLKRSMKCQDEVLAIELSKDNKYLCVALLDNTVQIFFYDTLKFYITLYGHKLPVFSMDISFDNELIVTGSADKNVKIWGIAHGDCHKSIFAHKDSIMQIRFVQNTHYFFSASKDGSIKYWDANKFIKICELTPKHCGEIWSMAINSTGQLLCTAGGDRSLRFWMESSENVFPRLEERKELEKLFDTDGNNTNYSNQTNATPIEKSGLLDTNLIESSMVSNKNSKSLSSIEMCENLMDSLDLADSERSKKKQLKSDYKMDQTTKLKMLNCDNAQEFMFKVILSIHSCDLEQVLILLPFNYVLKLLYYLNYFVDCNDRGSNDNQVLRIATPEIEFITRCVLYCIKMHSQELIYVATNNDANLKFILQNLRQKCRKKLTEYRDCIGFNLQAIQFMQHLIENKSKFAFAQHRYKKAIAQQGDSQLYKTWKE